MPAIRPFKRVSRKRVEDKNITENCCDIRIFQLQEAFFPKLEMLHTTPQDVYTTAQAGTVAKRNRENQSKMLISHQR